MPPKASEPEPGSVIAQAPILSRVRRSRAQRSFCTVVPFERMAGAGQADADTHRSHHARAVAAELDDRDQGCRRLVGAGGGIASAATAFLLPRSALLLRSICL